MSKSIYRHWLYWITALLLVASIVFYILGLCYPILSNHIEVWKWNFNHKDVNIFDSVVLFFEAGDYLVATVIFVFTFLFPSIKYIELAFRMATCRFKNNVPSIDKWNMLDVFLVALLLLNFKMNGAIMAMDLEIGTTFIALAVLTRMSTIIAIEQLSKQIDK